MRNVFLLLIFCFSVTGIAQDYQKLNSMKREIIVSPKDTQLIANLYTEVVKLNRNTDADSIFTYFSFLLDVSSKVHHERVVGNICAYFGNYYNGTGDYTKALTYLFASERAYLGINADDKLPDIYSTIGNTYMGLQNSKEQLNYFSKAFDLAVKNNIISAKARSAGGMASYYGGIKNYLEAVKWNDIAVQAFKEQKNYIGYCIALSNGSALYLELNFPDKARADLKIAERYLDSASLNYASFVCYKAIGDMLYKQKKYTEALVYFKKCLNLMIQDKAIHNISETYLTLSQTAYQAKLYKESTDYLNLHIQFKDSIFNETSSKQLLEVQEKYETDKKNVEISLLNKENDLTRSELDRKKIFTYSAVGFTILLLILFIFVIKSNIRKNKTNSLLEKQKVIIEEKQREIVDSINYAKRIQYTFLANSEKMKQLLPQHFVFFQPKDIVSGDFYWMAQAGGFMYFAVCDCTGHGVPGAFMSLLNSNFLHEAINEKSILDPAEVLNYVREKIITALDGGKDGMDTILIRLPDNFSNQTNSVIPMQFASANNKLVIAQNNTLVEFPTDKMPVGQGENMHSFTSTEIELKKGDTLYLYTDGYPDQFGGPKGKKFKYKALNELLTSISVDPLEVQKQKLQTDFDKWKGDMEQVDDVCVVGIRI